MKPLFARKFNRQSKWASRACLLIALALVVRSLVAPGFMVIADGKTTFGLSVVLCPAQNRGLDLEKLLGGEANADHGSHFHHSAAEPTHDSTTHTGTDASALDRTCLLWSGSASAVVSEATGFLLADNLDVLPALRPRNITLPATIIADAKPRAPPA
jgi:hypothetical protein